MIRAASRLLCLAAVLLLGPLRAAKPGFSADSAPIPAREPISRTARIEGENRSFTFALAADMRNYAGAGTYDTSQYFRGAVEAIAALGGGAFLISPGDGDPLPGVLWTITRTLGSAYPWYPVVGNHELPGAGYEDTLGANMDWLNRYDYGAVRPGPSGCPTTTFSFDYLDAHLVVLNEYCTEAGDRATDGDVSDHLYDWLVDDLDRTTQAYIFVIGHEPAYPQPDMESGQLRHVGDSLDQYPAHRDRFWSLLRDKGVLAYICGHTHSYSAVRIDGVWQLDVGHARGLGDTGARSTFVLVHVGEGHVRFETFRSEADGRSYVYADSGYFAAGAQSYLPVILRGQPQP